MSDLKQWLDSISEDNAKSLSPYHDSAEELFPVAAPQKRKFVQPHDYKQDLYLWHEDGKDEFPEMNVVAGSKTSYRPIPDTPTRHQSVVQSLQQEGPATREELAARLTIEDPSWKMLSYAIAAGKRNGEIYEDNGILYANGRKTGEPKETSRLSSTVDPAWAQWQPMTDIADTSRWMFGDCAAWAAAYVEKFPQLRFAVEWHLEEGDWDEMDPEDIENGMEPEQEWVAQHVYAHDDSYAYDARGTHLIEDIEDQGEGTDIEWDLSFEQMMATGLYEAESKEEADTWIDETGYLDQYRVSKEAGSVSDMVHPIGLLPEQFQTTSNMRREAEIWKHRIPFLLDPQGNRMVGYPGDWHADFDPEEIKATFGLAPDADPWKGTSKFQGMAMVDLPGEDEDIWQWPRVFEETNAEFRPEDQIAYEVQNEVIEHYDSWRSQRESKAELSDYEKSKQNWYERSWKQMRPVDINAGDSSTNRVAGSVPDVKPSK